MSESEHSYPFDPTGSRGTNLIKGEKHALSPPAWKDYHFIIPKLAPFFRNESFKIFDQRTGQELVEGVDWMATHRFLDASRATAKPVYGSITFFDKELAGVVRLEYQTLGGEWTIDDDLITEILIQKATNPRITTWEEVVDVPDRFPVIDHEWHLDDLVGMSEVRKSIDGIAQSILDSTDVRPVVNEHINNKSNPHETDKIDVGLGMVANFPISTRAEAIDGESGKSYMTPMRTRQAVESQVGEVVAEHADRRDNPHGTTKATIGLDKVVNVGLAEKNEAIDGVTHEALMTPLRTKEAIDGQVGKRFRIHLNNKSNPHETDKADVGLGLVANHPPATPKEAKSGTRDDRTMSPATTRTAIERFGRQYTDEEIDKVIRRIQTLEDELEAVKDQSKVDRHLLRLNPHETELSDVELEFVENAEYLTIDDIDLT